jgi:uncharacterized protein YbbK (DUF523 family)
MKEWKGGGVLAVWKVKTLVSNQILARDCRYEGKKACSKHSLLQQITPIDRLGYMCV